MKINAAFLIGFVSAIFITVWAIATAGKSPGIFIDPHAIALVIGGTITVAFLAFPLRRIASSFGIIFRKAFGVGKVNYLETIRLIVNVSQAYRSNPKQAFADLPEDAHPYFKDGMKMLVEFGFTEDDLDDCLTSALNGKKKRDEDEVKLFMTISRFPPAFGLLGATLGMISLLQSLGEPGAQDRVGPAMAVALVATFYGLVVANFILIPLAERLAEVSREDLILRKIIKEGVMLIHQKRHPMFIEEYLKSFLAPKERQLELLANGGASGSGQKAA